MYFAHHNLNTCRYHIIIKIAIHVSGILDVKCWCTFHAPVPNYPGNPKKSTSMQTDTNVTLCPLQPQNYTDTAVLGTPQWAYMHFETRSMERANIKHKWIKIEINQYLRQWKLWFASSFQKRLTNPADTYLDGVLAYTKGVPQLDGLVSGSRDNLAVVGWEGNTEDILGMTNEPTGRLATVTKYTKIKIIMHA